MWLKAQLKPVSLLLGVAFGAPAFADCADTDDTDGTAPLPSGNDDCDEDGYAKGEGDCDDDDPAINPGQEEVCENHDDDNCDGFFDEACERTLQRGSLMGGSTCATGVGSGWFGLAAITATLLGRRVRRC